ncbi:MAG: hypothetical protein WCO75_01195 [Planctomycetota bacterium]
MPTEPTILHVTGADLDVNHDAAVIFVDHQGARVRFLDGPDLAAVTAAHLDIDALHNKFRVRDNSLVGGFGRSHPDETPLFAKLSHVVLRCGKVLVVGPGSTKNEFVSHLERNHPGAMSKHIIGVRTVDHPTDGQLVALARTAFAEAIEAGQLHSTPVQSAQASSATTTPIRSARVVKDRAER